MTEKPIHLARPPIRVNPTQTLGPMAYVSDRANKDIRRSVGMRGYEPSYKPPTVATPATINSFANKESYKTGDGDNYHQPQREGSDHSYIKSKGHKC